MADSVRLEPLQYHRRLLEHVQSREREVWDWFASARVRSEHFDAVRLRLLRSAYRIDRETQPLLYRLAGQAAEAVGQNGPITLYQAQQAQQGMNAGLVWMPNESHLVLEGPLAERLTEAELLAVFGHELAHAVLWSTGDGEYHVLDRVLEAMANDAAAEPTHVRSRQLLQLYTEIFCDRGALVAASDLEVAVSALVKLSTGVREVNARSFLQQAEEALEADSSASEGGTHPEDVIRARCLHLWSEQADHAEERIRTMIEGKTALSRLDLLAQVELTQLTRDLVEHLVKPAWMRSEGVLAHARLFFEDARVPEPKDAARRPLFALTDADPQLPDYFSYVLLDFVTSDPDLREPALAHALLVARELGVEDPFLQIARKELGLRKRQVESLEEKAEKIVAHAEAAGSAE